MLDRERLVELFKGIYQVWITERPAQFAASLAYYGIFAFVPLIFIGLLVAGVFIDEIQAADQLFAMVADALGTDASQLLEDALAGLSESRAGGSVLSSVVSTIALLSAASLMFFQLQFALNTIWKIPPPQRGETRGYVTKRLMSFVMVFSVGFFLLAAMLAGAVISAIGSFLHLETAMAGVTSLAAIAVLAAAMALLYKILPDAHVAWRDVLIGSTISAVLIVLGLKLLTFYLSRGSVGSALEAAGAIAIFLLAFYFLGQIVVFGAVFTRVFSSVYGSGIVPNVEAQSAGASVGDSDGELDGESASELAGESAGESAGDTTDGESASESASK